MSKLFTVYCLIVLAAFETANVKGYTLSTLLSGQHHAGKSDNHYHK